MNRKLIFHLCLLVALVCLVGLLWTGGGGEDPLTQAELEAAIANGTASEDPLTGEWVIKGREEGIDQGGGMILKIGMLVALAAYSAVVFIVYILPVVVGRFTVEMLGSEDQVEADPMHDAHALHAQGDFPGAIEAYREVAAEQPANRLPWIEIAKIQRENLEDPHSAITTLRNALESYDWRVNDAAFFMFRLAEMYEQDVQDQVTAIEILQQVVELFPETRHSANATHRLRELGAL